MNIGDIFAHRLGDEYEIVEKLEQDKLKIRFLNSGFEKIITTNTSIIGGVIDDSNGLYVVGKSFVNKDGCKFVIIEIIDKYIWVFFCKSLIRSNSSAYLASKYSY